MDKLTLMRKLTDACIRYHTMIEGPCASGETSRALMNSRYMHDATFNRKVKTLVYEIMRIVDGYDEA